MALMHAGFSPDSGLQYTLQQLYMEPEVGSLKTIHNCGFIFSLAIQLEKRVDKLVHILSDQLKRQDPCFPKRFVL